MAPAGLLLGHGRRGSAWSRGSKGGASKERGNRSDEHGKLHGVLIESISTWQKTVWQLSQTY